MPLVLYAEGNVIHIYHDADVTHHFESSDAIRKGIEVALNEIDSEIEGYKVVYKQLDHRGNVVRSKNNYSLFINDPKALVVYSGLSSPPLIKNRGFINENRALTLVPWAAGGTITRYPSQSNWIFRLSIDDTQAASVILDFVLNRKRCKKPHLVIEDSPWGDSNVVSLTQYLVDKGFTGKAVHRFSWGTGSLGAGELLRNVIGANGDCMVLVGNSVESAVIINELIKLPSEQRIPVISHWGLTGGNFLEIVPASDLNKIDLSFIQTCFAFTNPHQSHLAKKVFEQVKEHSDGLIDKPGDLKSAVGFIHAYDLTRVLIQAIRQAGLSGEIESDRAAIRTALENLQHPVEGLIKTYTRPFSVFDEESNVNAHEALHRDDYCMASFGSMGEVVIFPPREQ